MEFFGDLERLLSEDLYPYRWPVAIGAAVGVFAVLVLLYRLRWGRPPARHPAASAIVLLAALAVMVPAGWYVLSPLWERSYLEETRPLEAAGAAASSVPDATMAELVEV